jgi:hypothetical protein
VTKRVAKASLLCKHSSLPSATDKTFPTPSTDVCEDNTFSDVVIHKGMPEQYIEQFQFKGCGGHRLRTMECLGLVDKDTIRNLTRDFHNSEAETEKHEKARRIARSLSPVRVSPHRPANPADKPLNSACQFLSPELRSPQFPTPRRGSRLASAPRRWGRLASADAADACTLKFGADETWPESPAPLYKSLSAPSTLQSMQAGTSLQRHAVRTLLEDLNASPDITMRSILDLSRDNHHGREKVFCELHDKDFCLQIHNIPKGPSVDGGGSWISRAPSVMYLISMYSLNMQLVPGPRGELNTLRIEVEGASQQGSDRPDTKNRRSPVAIVAGHGSSKAAVNKTFGISLHSPDTQLIKRWYHALTRCRVNAGSFPASRTSPQFPLLKRSSTMTSLKTPGLQAANRENGQLCAPECRDAIVGVPSALRRAPTHNVLVG